MMEMLGKDYEMKTSPVKSLCQLVLSRSYGGQQIPKICRWLIEQERNEQYRLQMTRMDNNNTDNNIQITNVGDISLCCDLDYSSVNTAPNITLILIISAIFIILLISALLTCNRRKRWIAPAQRNIDIDTESAMNMRIASTLARLSRVHVVSLHHPDHPDYHEHDDDVDQQPAQPPPDYDTIQQIKKKEDEDLPSYCQAVGTCHM